MIKLIGALLIITTAGGFGLCKSMLIYRQIHQLRQLLASIEIIKCELNYTLRPLSQLCRHTAERLSGAVAAFYENYAENIDSGQPRAKASAQAMEQTKSIALPNDAKMAILELCSTIGRYDLDGENRLLQLTGQRLKSALERFEGEKRPLAKSYAVLGLTTGIAMVILFI